MKLGKVITLSGGVGGAKLVLGLSHVLPEKDMMVVVNTGDDFTHFGLRICPDIDTLLYTLSGLSDPIKGWGRANETWSFMNSIKDLGGEDWFNLGDGDLALHVVRTERLKAGLSASAVTKEIATSLGIAIEILPMSNNLVKTIVHTAKGSLSFQHYFVREKCAPSVVGFDFVGIDKALPNPILMANLTKNPSVIIIAPSNPFVSVDPILSLPGLRAALRKSGAPIVAVSPIVGGKALKGPAAKMMFELGKEVSVLEVARHYSGFVDGLIIDEVDAHLSSKITDLGLKVLITPAVMHDLETRIQLARKTLDFASKISCELTR